MKLDCHCSVPVLVLWCVSLCAGHATTKHAHQHDNIKSWKDVPLRDTDLIADKAHMKEHLKDKAYIDVDKMSTRDFYIMYFKEHDADENGLLDGLEIMEGYWHSATGHSDGDEWIQELLAQGDDPAAYIQGNTDYVERSTDNTLKELDRNNDGYLSFAEFVYDTPIREQYWKDPHILW